MPLSMDEATRRYVENIQDSIYAIESFLGNSQGFDFKLPQVITNLQHVDLFKEERSAATAIQIFQEYKKMVLNEKKGRSMMTTIQAKKQLSDLKTQFKMRRRSERVRIQPYTLNNEQRATSTETIDLPLMEEE